MTRKMIMFALMTVILVLVGILITTSIVAQDEVNETERERPTIMPPDARQAVDVPTDDREVAVIQVVFEAEAGDEGEAPRVSSAEVNNAYILNRYAPNVVARQGAWTVQVVGENGEFRYGIDNLVSWHVYPPADREQDEDHPIHETYVQSGIVVDLVVPLYADEGNIGAQQIMIMDENGETIFEIDIDHDAWVRTGNELLGENSDNSDDNQG